MAEAPRLDLTLGIVGGTGALGGAIASALLRTDTVDVERLWLANRSGDRAMFGDRPEVTITTSPQALADACDVILLAVPPATAPAIAMQAPDRLVVSVMAGVTIATIGQLTGTKRIVRAMSSPAAERSLAYSPWCAGPGIDATDRRIVQTLFVSCGLADEVPNEDQIDHFTALTGPVPGFVAYFAECMVGYATRNGVAPAFADRAIRQLFRASGEILADSPLTPAAHVEAMIAYAGTTAAGLNAMRGSVIATAVDEGLHAAYRKARSLG